MFHTKEPHMFLCGLSRGRGLSQKTVTVPKAWGMSLGQVETLNVHALALR